MLHSLANTIFEATRNNKQEKTEIKQTREFWTIDNQDQKPSVKNHWEERARFKYWI